MSGRSWLWNGLPFGQLAGTTAGSVSDVAVGGCSPSAWSMPHQLRAPELCVKTGTVRIVEIVNGSIGGNAIEPRH